MRAMNRAPVGVGAAIAAIVLVGCNGDSSIATPAGDPAPPPATPEPGGVWFGVEVIPGQSVRELVMLSTDNGRFHVIREDGMQSAGRLTNLTATHGSGDYVAAHLLGESFDDDSSHALGAVSASYETRDTFELEWSLTTGAGTGVEGWWSLEYDDTYEAASRLTTIAGAYTGAEYDAELDAFVGNGNSMSITDTGAIWAQSAATDCITNGQVSTIDRDRGVYDVYFWYEGCTGPEAALNDVEFEGLAMLDDRTGVEMIVGGAIGQVDGEEVAVSWFHQRQ